jgi:hypothetical protein
MAILRCSDIRAEDISFGCRRQPARLQYVAPGNASSKRSSASPAARSRLQSVGAEARRAKAGCAREVRLGTPKNIENNPMQSKMVSLAWML